jgi:hypothetical protein
MPESDQDILSPNGRSGRPDWRSKLLLPLTLATIGALALIVWLFARSETTTPTLSSRDVSATREAVQFATSEAARQATIEIEAPSRTALARITASAEAHERETATTVASTAQARATTHARDTAAVPVTQTAMAQAFERAHAQADATTQALTQRATLLFGPSSGILEQREGDQAPQVACEDPHLILRDFIAEATFHNPTASDPLPSPPAWDYGFIFSNLDGETEYRLILDSGGSWTLNLHSSGFDISNRDSTPLLNLSTEGSNTLKLYVTGDTSYLYINGQYIDTLDLAMFGMAQPSGSAHDISICAGIMVGNAIAGRPTLYDGFTVWSLP